MTDPTGLSFLSYRRGRAAEAKLLIEAQRDRGIPTWQDVTDLPSSPTEIELRRVLADPATANAILFVTPEVEELIYYQDNRGSADFRSPFAAQWVLRPARVVSRGWWEMAEAA